MRVRAHSCVALGSQAGELGHEPPLAVEQFVGPVTAQPLLKLGAVVAVAAYIGDRYLMRAPGSLDRLAFGVRRISIGQRPDALDPSSRAAC